MRENILTDNLVDIRDVNVDTNLLKFERIAEYVRQIRDPYHFKCGEYTVSVKYAAGGVKFEDCLKRIVG